MSKFKITLIILFIIGIIGALNSISNQSTVDQERGFLKGILSALGLTYIPEPEEPREFEYIPAKTQSELSKISSENQDATPSAAQSPKNQQINQNFYPTPKPFTSSPPSSSPNPYGFGFSN